MRKFALPMLAVLVGLFAIMLNAAPASAQATRTWVSGVGDDANPCSRTAPCKTFAGAISKTAAAGEINVLDPGGFGALTITKAITVRADHVEAGVLVAGTQGFTVQAGATDTVVIEGLDFDGDGSGLNGVNILSGAKVYIIRCAIRRFTQNGINMTSSTSGARLVIQDSVINLNGSGVNVQGNGVGNAAVLVNTVVDGNTSFALQANGASNSVALITSILGGSPAGINALNNAVVAAFGPSNVITGTGAPTEFVAFK